jgi:hypothetical protein
VARWLGSCLVGWLPSRSFMRVGPSCLGFLAAREGAAWVPSSLLHAPGARLPGVVGGARGCCHIPNVTGGLGSCFVRT